MEKNISGKLSILWVAGSGLILILLQFLADFLLFSLPISAQDREGNARADDSATFNTGGGSQSWYDIGAYTSTSFPRDLLSIPQTYPTAACSAGLTCKKGSCVQYGGKEIFPPVEQSSLREYAQKRGILIGTTIQHNKWELDSAYKPTLAKEFNSAQLFTFMSQVELQHGQFNFSRIDEVINFAQENNLRLIGDSLVYGLSSVPNSWLKFDQPDCGGWSKQELDQILKEYIHTVVSHVGGSAYAWKVVNEPLTAAMQDSCWKKILDDDYIAKAFQYAQVANPEARLMINDHFGNAGVDRQKTDQYFSLISFLKQQALPVHIAGIQMHLDADKLRSIYLEEFRYFLEKAEQVGVQVHVTEMDVYQKAPDPQKQKEIYQNILATCLEYSHCTNFTVWGLTDKYSWLKDFYADPNAKPLLFDENYQRKPAYYGVMEALKENTTRACRVGDFNFDDEVNLLDLLRWRLLLAQNKPEADVNADGQRDLLDYLFLLQRWLRP